MSTQLSMKSETVGGMKWFKPIHFQRCWCTFDVHLWQIFQITFLQLDSNLWTAKHSENRNNMILAWKLFCCSGPNHWSTQLTLCCTHSTNFLLVLKALIEWRTLMPCNLDVIFRYYINIAPFPPLFSVDMISTQKGEAGIDKHYNWNVERVIGLSEKLDISLGDMNKLNLLWILQNWWAVNISKPLLWLFFSIDIILKVWCFLLFLFITPKWIS